MKFLRQGVALAVLGAGLAAAPGISATAASAPAPDDTSMIQQMRSGADGSTAISKEGATGEVGFIRAATGGDLLPSSDAAPAAKADAYLNKFSSAFGAPRGQLVRDGVQKNEHGTTVNYVQQFKGVPVFGSLLRAHVNEDGDLTSVNGEVVPDLKLSVDPTISKDDAADRALQTVEAHPPGEDGKADTSGIKAADTELMVYRTGLVNGTEGTNELVWRVEVTNEENIRDMVFISATHGKPVNRYSMIHDALDRVLFEADENRDLTQVWQEGDPLPGDLNDDQESMVRSTGEAYWFFANAFGRDGYDGKGSTMYTINNDPAIKCPNANWNGQTTNYCDGVSSDDVVAHEWGHAYSEYTHGLIYQWQAGALNEAYSDIWGETVDLINGRLDEEEGNLNLTRTVDTCSIHSPAKPLLTINSPKSIAKECLTGGASFGEQLDEEGISGDVVAPTTDESEGTTDEGCTAYNEDVTGKIVLVNRGTCPFTQKAEVAGDAGAAALIIGNNDDSAPSMSGDDETLPTTVSIGMTDREAIRTALGNGEAVNVSMKDAGGEREDTYRWLIGEKSTAFGGAIRDMWNPTCYGDPGKVTDAEYKCSTDDNGGVHGNSGVPNHGYALLVDGGTYNDTTVEGIGLTKAAHIYFKAMNEYQTPVSDFTDHADSLEASCADLTGKRLTKLSTKEDDAAPAHDKITADDCAQVAAMAKAVELRVEPVQCDFQPMLPDKAGSPCGEGFESTSVFSEDFENGFEEWTQDEELAEGAVKGYAWESSFDAPERDNGVAFGPDPLEGDCIPDSDDISSANSLISPEITVPEDGIKPVVSFDHYVATESGWDGGLVRVKVNDGDFETVPTEAYLVNGPNMTMETEEAGNTSPLAGEEGFSGTDGGELKGSWGTSQIDLEALDVAAGDTVQVAFVMGRDGCNGFDGWYVDNVELTVCDAAAAVSAVQVPKPGRFATASKVDVTVAAAGDAPTGEVEVTEGATSLGTAEIDADGKASVNLPARLSVGVHDLTVSYAGDDTYAAAETALKARVIKAASTTAANAKPVKIKKKGATTVTARIKVPGIPNANGRVQVVKAGTVLGGGKLAKGSATIKVPGAKLTLGKNRLVVRYVGNANIAKSQKVLNVQVTK